jgi:hypothetical protein
MATLPNIQEESLGVKHLHEIIGKLYLEMLDEHDRAETYKKVSQFRKETVDELYRDLDKKREADWEIMRLQRLLKNAGI